MKITSLKASGIAGQNFSHELAPVTVITGANARGKTTRLNALLFGLVGYVPGLPRTNSGLFKELASESSLCVHLGINSDPNGIARSLIENRGTIKMAYDGPEITVPPVMIDAGEFMNLSERERVKFVFARTAATADTRKVVHSIIANLKSIKLDPHPIEAESIIGDLVNEVSKIVADNVVSIQELVDLICTDLGQKKKDAEAGVKRLVKAQEAMTQTADTDLPPPADCEQQLIQRQTVLTQVNKDIGTHSHAVRSIAAEKTEALAAQLKLSSEEGQRTELAALKALLAKGRRELPAKPGEPSMEKYQKLQEELGRCVKKHEITFKAWSDKDRVVRQLETDLENLNQQGPKCSKCGSDITASRDSLISICNSQLAAARAEAKPVEEAYSASGTEKRRVQGLVDSELAAFQEAGKALREWQAKTINLVVLERKISTLESDLAKNGDLHGKVAKLPEIETRLNNARTELQSAQSTAQTINNEITHIIQPQIRRLHQLRGKAQERAKMEAETIAQQLQLDVLKQAVAMMDDLRAKLVEEAIKPLLTTLNRFSAGMLPRPLTYQDGRIGCQVNGSFVEKTLSGAEKAVALGAISVALAAESPLKILILDELTRLDPDNKLKFIGRMLELVEDGTLHQVVLTDTNSHPYVNISAPNFKLIQL